jgi:hypothetical protein
MKPAQIHQLEASAREELGAQGRLLGLLEAEERALVAGDAPSLLETLAEIDQEVALASGRAARRRELFEQVAQSQGAVAGALSFGSLCERAGEDGPRLRAAREELARLARAVDARMRRLSILARAQESILGEVIALLAGRGGRALDERGALLDAKA